MGVKIRYCTCLQSGTSAVPVPRSECAFASAMIFFSTSVLLCACDVRTSIRRPCDLAGFSVGQNLYAELMCLLSRSPNLQAQHVPGTDGGSRFRILQGYHFTFSDVLFTCSLECTQIVISTVWRYAMGQKDRMNYWGNSYTTFCECNVTARHMHDTTSSK